MNRVKLLQFDVEVCVSLYLYWCICILCTVYITHVLCAMPSQAKQTLHVLKNWIFLYDDTRICLTRADKNNNSSAIHEIDDGKRSQYQSKQKRNALGASAKMIWDSETVC